MAANALVVRKNQLPTSQKALPAAQYVRMSTDYQRYSIENQAAAIAAYAQLRDLSIVCTYRDEGESGLKLKNRAGLAQPLDDVSSHQVDFEYILVYDVTRPLARPTALDGQLWATGTALGQDKPQGRKAGPGAGPLALHQDRRHATFVEYILPSFASLGSQTTRARHPCKCFGSHDRDV